MSADFWELFLNGNDYLFFLLEVYDEKTFSGRQYLCIPLLGVIGCGGETMAGYQKIPAAEAKNMMDKGGVTVVDVRREEEYKTGHIPEAVLLTNETIGNEPPALLPDKNAVILVYCRSGVRSRQASEKLIKLGYKRYLIWVVSRIGLMMSLRKF